MSRLLQCSGKGDYVSQILPEKKPILSKDRRTFAMRRWHQIVARAANDKSDSDHAYGNARGCMKTCCEFEMAPRVNFEFMIQKSA